MSDHPEKPLNPERIEAPVSGRKSSEPSTAREDGMRRDGSLTSNLHTAQKALEIVESILIERGFTPDSSARHNLSIAQSVIRDAQKGAHETRAPRWPEYSNAIGDAGYQYMQRYGGRISSGMFYWHELWDALNAAVYSLEHVRQSPPASVPAIGAPTGSAAPGSVEETGPKPDAEKAPVTSAKMCPTWDQVQHEEQNGKCIYCGAPMSSENGKGD